MTIKHMNKNISAEKAQVVTNITSSPNGLLVTKTNLHDETNVSDAIDLTGTKLHLMILNSNNDLDLLADCDTDNKLEALNNYFEGEYQISFDSLAQLNDYIQSKMFLVEDSTSREEDNIYNEYIWMNGAFELIGTTRIDLTNYIQKSNGTNLLLTDGTNIAQSTFAQATALTSKENTSNKVTSWSATTTDTNYPSEKLVKDSLDLKADSSLLSTVATTGDYDDLSDKPNIPKVFYGTSGTSASTQTKVVTTSSDFSLESGVILFVKFSNAQDYNGTTGSELKLKVNDGSSINVVLDNSGNANAFATRYVWQGGEVVGFVYIGTRFLLLDRDRATTTYYGVTKLTDSTSSTSTTTSATPNSVKAAYDLADSREDPSNKVTTMSSSSTDTQYPSAKAVYDALPKTTKTLTVTYTNGTTEDIEFYIR